MLLARAAAGKFDFKNTSLGRFLAVQIQACAAEMLKQNKKRKRTQSNGSDAAPEEPNAILPSSSKKTANMLPGFASAEINSDDSGSEAMEVGAMLSSQDPQLRLADLFKIQVRVTMKSNLSLLRCTRSHRKLCSLLPCAPFSSHTSF